MLLEVACFNLESALIAQKADANRIELCENYLTGGLTPSKKLIQEARAKINIELYIMIRPRSGNFNYSNEEYIQMQEAILFCKENNCDGLVFGILNKSSDVDTARCKELVDLAKPLPSTFHRAFDECKNSEVSLNDIISCGFTRILTSGDRQTALDGAGVIKNLIDSAKNRIIIMPGGGIRSENIEEILKLTGANEFHSAAIMHNAEIANENEIKSLLEKLKKH